MAARGSDDSAPITSHSEAETLEMGRLEAFETEQGPYDYSYVENIDELDMKNQKWRVLYSGTWRKVDTCSDIYLNVTGYGQSTYRYRFQERVRVPTLWSSQPMEVWKYRSPHTLPGAEDRDAHPSDLKGMPQHRAAEVPCAVEVGPEW